jgi:hypothetical protein
VRYSGEFGIPNLPIGPMFLPAQLSDAS